MMSVHQRQTLSQSQEDYLKALYELGARARGLVGTTQLSERLQVSAPSAAQMLTRLAALGLVLGATVELVRESRYEGPLSVRIAGRRRQVALGVARAVFVE